MTDMPVPKKLRIAVIDDHPMTRDGIGRWISGEPDMEVCWEAASAEDAIASSLVNIPDLVVADISLPGRNGIEFIKEVRGVLPSLPVIVLSMHAESIYAQRALRAGAHAYIMKHEGGSKLLATIRSAIRGQIGADAQMPGRTIDGEASPATRGGVGELSDREFEIFELLGAGLPTGKIGERLGISAKTVDSHRANIKAKLGIKKMAELVAYAATWVAS